MTPFSRAWCLRRRRRAVIAQAYRLLRYAQGAGKLPLSDRWLGEEFGWVKRWRFFDIHWHYFTKQIEAENRRPTPEEAP